MHKNKLYLFLTIACIAGYGWLLFAFNNTEQLNNNANSVCLIKQATNLPCPSCGTTRSAVSIINGNFSDAFLWNPFGFVVLAIMLLLPIWLLSDFIKGNNSLQNAFLQTEKIVSRKWIAVSAIFLVAANWIWNIYKEL